MEKFKTAALKNSRRRFFMKSFGKTFFVFAAFSIFSLLIFSCEKNSELSNVRREEKFTLNYGSLENQIRLFNLNSTEEINTHIAMRNGFFFISNGESQKILQMNSFGELLTLYHNPETNPAPLFDDTGSNSDSAYSTKKTVAYPFNSPSFLAADSHQYFYAVETLPKERYEISDERILRQIVLRFNSDSFVDYIGQQGIGGMPFPFIRNIYTTQANDLVVVCIVVEGFLIFCYDNSGTLLYEKLIKYSDAPEYGEKSQDTTFSEIENVVPDPSSRRLFVKADYYENSDFENFSEPLTVIFPFDPYSGEFKEGIEIPPYEESITQGFAKQTYKLPYNFIGAASDWLFFMISVDSGSVVQMVNFQNGRILRRHLGYDTSDTVYSAFSLSESGIISALLAGRENAKVVWWRTDDLARSIAEAAHEK